MAITVVPAFPLRSQGLSQSDYSSGVEASLSAIPNFINELNAAGDVVNVSTTGSSVTSNTIGTGAKSFTTQTGLGYGVGRTLRMANSSTNFMTGEVTSYNSGTGSLVMNITSVSGSGTFTSWVITLGAVGASTAGTVSATPGGNLAGATVQAQLTELDAEKAGLALNNTFTGTNDFLNVTAESALIDGAGGLGFTTGSGGSVTQATSKTTAVTLNKYTGRITMNAAALVANTTVTFTLNNSLLEAGDVIILNHIGGGTVANYNTWVATGAGSATINVRNITAGSLSDALILQYVVIKGEL